MTVRLVALMSVVLLLSLGAFGLLINHYQDQLMTEVAQTASEAGRAALSTLDFKRAGIAVPVGRHDANSFTWRSATDDQGPVAGETATVDAHVTVQSVEGSPELKRIVRRLETERSDGEVSEAHSSQNVIMIQQYADEAQLQEFILGCESTGTDGEKEERDDCIARLEADALGHVNRFFISIEGVRAEADPAEGLVLTVPRLASAAVVHETGVVRLKSEEDDPVNNVLSEDDFEELRLPLAGGDYGELFQSIRDRSLFIFLGVLVVGTVLSAGVASRFTRPIRRLDAGIRRLSAGDLEVQVDAQGKDEVARLGRAFNEMTRSLRANRQRSREMVRREKLSALGRLAAGVAHDVRNPLHSIGLTLDHLNEGCRPEDDQRGADFDRSVEIIRGEVRRLDRLVGNFLRFAKSDRRVRGPLDLRELLTETARLVKKEAEWRRVELLLELDEATLPVMGDGEAIRSSILNLVLNSFEAMPAGGKLTLSLRAEGDEVVVEVADTGSGIPPADQEKVFEFAYSTREGGHGLGLAMVHQCVVEEHGGRVDLQSSQGAGTRVRIALPAGDRAAEEES
jgi:signal transduction histidine kinase